MSVLGRRAETRVTDLRVERIAGKSRVCALVDGVRLWYSAKEDLSPSPEAFGSALLLPSMHRRRGLSLDQQVSTMWQDNSARLSQTWSEWWGYEPIQVSAPVRANRAPSSTATGLAFSCGVDSFHTLLHGSKPDLLVAVHGFDVPLADEYRMLAYSASVEAVAKETGIEWTIVRTNVREHPAMGRPWLWERAHGGGLAAIGHLLSDNIGRFTISSTYSADNAHAWGSTSETDPLFGSDQVAIEHVGTDVHREQKIRLISDSPLAQKHLRVCWENKSKSGNCSRCGKCVITMLLLAELGALDRFGVFAGTSTLLAALDALPHISTQVNITDRASKRGTLPPKIVDAARRLVVRSRKTARLRQFRKRIQEITSRV
ncbi:MAG: hypothetical protein ABJC63_06155 [Gemmatimonadales bacterium]